MHKLNILLKRGGLIATGKSLLNKHNTGILKLTPSLMKYSAQNQFPVKKHLQFHSLLSTLSRGIK